MSLISCEQFHLNGYEGSTDPLDHLFQGEKEPDFQTSLPEEVDVLIVGAGPAGHVLAAQLSRFPNITTRLVDAKNGRLIHGYADGLQCRTLELFEAFGFCEKVLKEAYWINETTFWSPTEDGKGIHRTGRIPDTPSGLSEQPHVILSQARMQDLWAECMKKSATRLEPTYNRRLIGLKQPEGDAPIEVTLERTDDANTGKLEHVRARYVVGCDGARSAVRESLGWHMKGDYSTQTWGVLDVLARSDFPDIRLKTTIHSPGDGSVLIIPREGGYMVRLYVELDRLGHDERVRSKNITSAAIVERAQRIFRPYTFEALEIPHFTVYEVGQRLTDHFDDVPPGERSSRAARIFIAGDACHTHSAKAGQGMNVSMNDTFNLGWKLASVLSGTSHPRILNTYSSERREVAQRLIDFDREWSAMFAARPKLLNSTAAAAATSSSPSSSSEKRGEGDGSIDPRDFQRAFEKSQAFTAGVETRYYRPGAGSNLLVSAEGERFQALARGFGVGTRFHSAQVLRLADAKPVQLGHVMRADGRWRVVIFGDEGGDVTDPRSRVAGMCGFLAEGVVKRYTPAGRDVDAVIDVRAVLPRSRKGVDVSALPPLLAPRKGRYGLVDYEKVFTDEESYGWGFGDIYNKRGVDREKGCVVVVRPDQYISAVLPLSEEAHRPLLDFFDGFMIVA